MSAPIQASKCFLSSNYNPLNFVNEVTRDSSRVSASQFVDRMTQHSQSEEVRGLEGRAHPLLIAASQGNLLSMVAHDVVTDLWELASTSPQVKDEAAEIYNHCYCHRPGVQYENRFVWWDEKRQPLLPPQSDFNIILPYRLKMLMLLDDCRSDLKHLKAMRAIERSAADDDIFEDPMSDDTIRKFEDRRGLLHIYMSTVKQFDMGRLPEIQEARDVLNELYEILPLDDRKKQPRGLFCHSL